jgi:hypothetical protein
MESLLDQGGTGSQDIDKLLGVRRPAHRPEPAADPPGHDNAVVVVGHWLLVTGYWLLVIGYWLLGISIVIGYCSVPRL